MERSKKLAKDGLVSMGFKIIYLAPPTPRLTRMKGRKSWISSGSNDPFGFDVIAVNDNLWYCIQATEEGHASERRKKVDLKFPVQPPNTMVMVWEYIFSGKTYRVNIYRRKNVGNWFKMKLKEPTKSELLDLSFKKNIWVPVIKRVNNKNQSNKEEG
ncbi:MAG: hypothetical protein QW292_02860 [Candidatus Parvarchaeota archaeon]